MSDARERLALYVCCGPCATVCLERLTPRFDVVPIWFNPNISPDEEHERRLEAARQACASFGLEVLDLGPMAHAEWLEMVVHGREDEPEGGERCGTCIAVRLLAVVAFAAREGAGLVTTTLTVGPQKDVARIHRIGRKLCEAHGLQWLEETFRKADGYHRSVELSSELGLYRQHYCGCEFSVRGAGPTTPPR